MEDKKQLKDFLVARFVWRIENFTSSNKSKLYSGTFVINEYRWRLLLFPKGNKVEYLSLYLDVPDAHSLPYGWSRTAKYSIALINQIDSKKTVKKETEHEFHAKESDWGFTSFFPLSELHDENGGYLVNDTCLIEAEVSVPDTFSVSTDNPSDTSVPVDPVESVYIKAESFLKSIPKKSFSSVSDATCEVPLFRDHAILAKGCFNKLISFPLDDLVNPKHETAMIESLSILSDNLSLFSDEQAREIMSLKANFPSTIQDWRDSVQVKVSGEHLWSTFEKTNNLLEDLVKTEEGIKTKLEELNNREKELEMQLEGLKSKSRQLKEERVEISKQTKQVYALAQEQSSKIKGKEPEVDLANKKLEDLKSKWASIKALFA
ncbi:MATH domain and coiled-coil domain-containing protein At3g58360-like isoform X2 [Olea europaea var. sylvestris]|uniref:MATH domain and coiled-coil domain-containing protein At3g58360-like isoform X2 n=1 Tax=Olea europaea var. sylvestris TaxID=158386 RepID=UPI000C1D2A39|nr:MATH domain and coiled-coil domain-containing protein At3g58360-like isoform X2 [Olea europaea var. sylvestris]XP_022872253.1 MATH domain and coiled-coil domain-containing protein At3g58360-like isoform X2 [Olea europaea var. sylvestris]XP_022872254.1 MATH domain and coiled-coil domain-containing protein At3g58360-like isoform X2 [Olea europaea var. sylvestris]XP_022872255.1 MATH domain and coiled-coil domain-containing protein At3g58360-like isoform X2 [Olea europaea var. sylvestris]XP_0228